MGSIPVANPSPPRRLAFPRRAMAVAVVVSAALVGLVVVSAFAWPTGSKVDQTSWFNAGPISEFAVNDPVRFPEHRFWLVKLGDDSFVALWAKGPHRGCTVPWRPNFEFMGKKGWFRDPCSNDTFASDGSHVFGPAPRGMDRFPVSVEDGTVRVNVRTVVLGPGGPPE